MNDSRGSSLRSTLDGATGDPSFLPRLAGALLIIAGFVVGIYTAVVVEPDPHPLYTQINLLLTSPSYPFLLTGGFWGFLIGSTLPIGLGTLLLVKAEGMRLAEISDSAIMYGRAAGIGVAVAGLVLGIWAATQGEGVGFWRFLLLAFLPMGVGLLILLSVEGMRGPDMADGISFYGRLAGVAMLVAGFGLGSWASASGGFWAFLGFAAPRMGLGLLVLLSVESMEAGRGSRSLDNAATYGKLVGAVIAIAGLAYGIWIATSIDDLSEVNKFLLFLLNAAIPMGIGFLIYRRSEDMEAGESALPTGWLALGILAAMGLASGIWLAVESYSKYSFLLFLGTAIIPISIGLLCSPILKKSA